VLINTLKLLFTHRALFKVGTSRKEAIEQRRSSGNNDAGKKGIEFALARADRLEERRIILEERRHENTALSSQNRSWGFSEHGISTSSVASSPGMGGGGDDVSSAAALYTGGSSFEFILENTIANNNASRFMKASLDTREVLGIVKVDFVNFTFETLNTVMVDYCTPIVANGYRHHSFFTVVSIV
jgi:hypothetical protein